MDGFPFFLSQGQVEAHVRLQANAPEDAEFYVVVQGSRLTHITTAKRGDDGLTLCFTVPGMSTSNNTLISLCHCPVPILIYSVSHRPCPCGSCHCHILPLRRGPNQAMRG